MPALLKQLAAACPPAETDAATRLLAEGAGRQPTTAPPRRRSIRPRRGRLLQRARPTTRRRARTSTCSTNSAADIVRAPARAATPERAEVVDAFDATLVRFQADPTLSRADRIGALIARVDLARIDVAEAVDRSRVGREAAPPPLAPALLADVREQAARADREITDGYERQAVITTAAYLLAHAGLPAESDALLMGNLAKSHSPYYLMTGLAENAARARRRDRRRCAGTARPSRRAKGRRRGCSGAPATSARWSSSRRRTRPRSAGVAGAAARRGGGAAERVLRAQRALAAARQHAAARLEPRAARTPPRCDSFDAQLRRSAPGSTPPTASARPATRCRSPRRRRMPERARPASPGGRCLSIRAMPGVPPNRLRERLDGAGWSRWRSRRSARSRAAPSAPAAPPSAPADAPPAVAAAPSRRAGALGPRLRAYGEPKYPRGFDALRLREPDAPKGGTLLPAQPGPAHELRQVQPVHDQGQRAGRR